MFSGSLKDIFGNGMGLGYRVFQLGLAGKKTTEKYASCNVVSGNRPHPS
jgi:hypothetical protein